MESDSAERDSGHRSPEELNQAYFEAMQRMDQRLQQTEAGLQALQNALNSSMARSNELETIVRKLSETLPGSKVPDIVLPDSRGLASGSKDWKPPQWDGTPDSFVDYIERLRYSYRTRSALHPPLSVDIYWNAIFESIKDSKSRSRMRHFWIQGAKSSVKDPGLFITEIENVFGDGNEKGRALEKLVNLRHESGQPWRDHQRIFDGLLLTACGDLFPDDVKITHLRNTFSNAVRLNLVSMPRELDYFGFTKEVDQIMTNYEETNQFKKAHRIWKAKNSEGAYSDSGTTSNLSTSTRTMDREGDTIMNVTRVAEGGQRPSASGNRGNPPRGQRRALWVDKSVLDARQKNGQCFRCGDSGHRVRDCPHLPATRPVGVNVIHSVALLENDCEQSENDAIAAGKD